MYDRGFILAIDQGTTGSTAILFDGEGRGLSRAYQEINQTYPEPGWVEHNPREIFLSCAAIAEEAVQKAAVPFSMIKRLGITNQRETSIIMGTLYRTTSL
jgi:glycerol kinase